MMPRTHYHYAYAFVFVAVMTAMFLVGGLLSARTTTGPAMDHVRIDVPAMMSSTDSTQLPVHHIENPF